MHIDIVTTFNIIIQQIEYLYGYRIKCIMIGYEITIHFLIWKRANQQSIFQPQFIFTLASVNLKTICVI